MMNEWVFFHVAVGLLLFLDLGILNRKAHIIEIKEALRWSAFWVALGLGFGAYIWFSRGRGSAMEYYTAYLIEESLSVDNLMVFAVIFGAFKIHRLYQHRLLFWGIIGAIVMRALMIVAGSQLIERFHFVLYIFGALLVYTGIKFLTEGEKQAFDPKSSTVYRFAQRFLPLTDLPHEGKFMLYDPHKKRRAFTMYFITLLIIESTDVLFAVDSVPAVLSISRDPFVVYTSNIAAILGLRSLFFVLEDMIKRFHLLQEALGVILFYVGAKMLVEKWVHIPGYVNLMIVVGVLMAAVILSILRPQKIKEHHP